MYSVSKLFLVDIIFVYGVELLMPILFYHFLYPATSKSAGYYVIPSAKNLRSSVCPSVRPSVRPSVSASFPCSNLSIYQPIFFKLCIEVYIRKEWFGIEDGQISSNKYRVMALDLL